MHYIIYILALKMISLKKYVCLGGGGEKGEVVGVCVCVCVVLILILFRPIVIAIGFLSLCNLHVNWFYTIVIHHL